MNAFVVSNVRNAGFSKNVFIDPVINNTLLVGSKLISEPAAAGPPLGGSKVRGQEGAKSVLHEAVFRWEG